MIFHIGSTRGDGKPYLSHCAFFLDCRYSSLPGKFKLPIAPVLYLNTTRGEYNIFPGSEPIVSYFSGDRALG